MKPKKTFDTLAFFSTIKKKLAEKMAGMTLAQQKEFLKNIREGKIKIASKNSHDQNTRV